MTRPSHGWMNVETGTNGAIPARLELERENELLRRQLTFILLQASEVRRECQAVEDRLASQVVAFLSRDTFSLVDFLPRPDGSPSPVLPEAIRFYETHDGCPFFDAGRCDDEAARCNGVWIRMGHPCWQLVARVKDIAGAVSR